MDTKELIESIITGNEETQKKFIETMDERVSDALEVRKVEIASGLIEAKMKDEKEMEDDEDEEEDEEEDEDDEEDDEMEDKKSMKKEETEQIDEVSAGKYAAVAAARGNEWDADVNYEKSNYSPKKLKDVVRRAGKKFGAKVASQLSTMQGTREKRNDARFSDEDDKLAKPFPGYDGAKTTKSGMMHKTFGRVLKNQIRNRLNKEEAEQVNEADKLAGLDYNKGHKLMYKGGKQKIVKTPASQQAHKAMGWKERHSVKAAMKAMKEDTVNEAEVSDAQKLAMMKEKNKSQVLTALSRYKKVGRDINKLSPAHRSLVSNYMEKTGGIGGLSRSVQSTVLKAK